MREPNLRSGVVLMAAGLLLGAALPAEAVECSTLSNPVYVAGSSAMKPVLKEVSKILSARTPAITLVYQSLGSCAGVDAIVNGTKVTASAKFWDADDGDAEKGCDLPVNGATADIGISDVYAESCGYELGAGQKDHFGPVQVMTFVAPTGSSENAISAEAAYVALGFGGETHVVAPWDNKDFFFIRPDSSGTKSMIGAAIGLPPSKWIGEVKSGSGDVNAAVASSVQADKTLGILAADWADLHRDAVKILAYQHKGQSCGYYPDSTANAFDKLNVREGRYAIWGSVHLIANESGGKIVPATGNPAGDYVATTLGLFTREGVSTAETKSMIQAEAAAFTVPLCAMKVTRDAELGTPRAYEPSEPCGCFFESLKGVSSDACTSCASDSDCSGSNPTCRFGFCEAR